MHPAWLVLALLAPAAGRRHPPDLREDEPARRLSRPAECQFGKQAKELGSSWFADLGPPFGIMYCIRCECMEVQKKRRVVAKVHCRNIKNECPEPSCDSPVLLPGRCCKTCPGDTTPDLVQEDTPQSVPDEEEFSNKHFGALLTGRSPLCIRRDDMSGVPLAPGVATARFIFRRRHLYWSVLLGPSMVAKPRALAFLDKSGRLLLEHPLKKSPGLHETYEARTDKLCGVWRRVPREYKRLLREGVLYVALIWGDEKNGTMDSALSGRISKYPALSTEMFTTLLEPEERPAANGGSACDDARGLGVQQSGWWGGTAVVTGVAGPAPSLHIGILYNGVFDPNSHEHSVRITLTVPDKNLTTIIIDELHSVPKPGYEMNILEVRTPVSSAQLRSLARGKMVLSVESTAVPERRISGTVRQRAACEVYHAPLLAERPPATVYPEGLAMVYIDKEGSLVYDIQFDNLGNTVPKITLVEEQTTKNPKGRRHSQVEILETKNGVFIRPSARIFPPLYEDQLAVHIGVDTGPPILRGRLVSRPLPDASGSGPALLRRTDSRTPLKAPIVNPIAGLAWVSIDSLCGLHYEVLVNGIIEDGWTTWLETYTAGEGNSRALGGAEGCLLEPSGHELAALNAGAAYLDVRIDNITALLRTRIPQIIVPPSCLTSVPWNNDNNELSPTNFSPPTDNSLPNTAACYHGGRTFEDGAQWKPIDECQMCECVQGTVRCEDVVCPYVGQNSENVLGSHCSVPVIKPPGQCCPICTNSTTAVWNESHGCHLSGHYYAPGSSWHPYLLPGGFDLCTVCTCDFSTRVVRCFREPCPPLKCSERDAYRPDKEACCRVCPETKTKNEEETLKDQGTPKTAEEILAEGGCVFPNGPLPNGKEVHPSIHSHGEQRCVTCRCKDGELKCQRKRCGRGVCSKRRGRHDACCPCPRPRRQRKRPEPPPRAPPTPAPPTPHS